MNISGQAREAKTRWKLRNERKGSNSDLNGKTAGLGVRRPGFWVSTYMNLGSDKST